MKFNKGGVPWITGASVMVRPLRSPDVRQSCLALIQNVYGDLLADGLEPGTVFSVGPNVWAMWNGAEFTFWEALPGPKYPGLSVSQDRDYEEAMAGAPCSCGKGKS